MTTRNITDEEAEVLLSNLKDNCARMRTPEFLWELCHNNYARQYDDRMTMLNAGKPAAELFFLGFPSLAKKSEFNRVITASTGDYNPQSSNPDMFSTFEIPEYKYAYISGYQMKLINAKKGVMSYNDYFITFWVPKKIVTNDTIIENRMKYKQFLETKTVEKITKKKNNEEYIKIFRKAHDVVINNIIILNEPFPVDVVVDDITFDELVHPLYISNPSLRKLLLKRKPSTATSTRITSTEQRLAS